MSPDALDSDPETPADEDRPDSGADEAAEDDDHLTSLDDGAGCTEIWEHLSEARDD
jgi:hypothetical protein